MTFWDISMKLASYMCKEIIGFRPFPKLGITAFWLGIRDKRIQLLEHHYFTLARNTIIK